MANKNADCFKKLNIAFIAHSIPKFPVCRSKSAPPTNRESCNKDITDELKLRLCEQSTLAEKATREAKELRNKIENMRTEWRSQQEHLGKLHQEFTKLQQTLGQHSVYCATLGATMGSLLWKVSRMEGTVENMLEGTRMTDLITIMDNSLKAFLDVFGHDIPDPCSNEYQFVLSWCGVLTNVSACPDGRYFLSTKSEGQVLMNRLVHSIPKFSTGNGLLLQRMILMVIYNLIINTNGMQLMQCNSKLIPILSKLVVSSSEPEIQDLLYKLILSISNSVTSKRYLEHLLDTLPMPTIDATAADCSSPLQECAIKIKENLEYAEKNMSTQKYVDAAERELDKQTICPKSRPELQEEIKKRSECKDTCKKYRQK